MTDDELRDKVLKVLKDTDTNFEKIIAAVLNEVIGSDVSVAEIVGSIEGELKKLRAKADDRLMWYWKADWGVERGDDRYLNGGPYPSFYDALADLAMDDCYDDRLTEQENCEKFRIDNPPDSGPPAFEIWSKLARVVEVR